MLCGEPDGLAGARASSSVLNQECKNRIRSRQRIKRPFVMVAPAFGRGVLLPVETLHKKVLLRETYVFPTVVPKLAFTCWKNNKAILKTWWLSLRCAVFNEGIISIHYTSSAFLSGWYLQRLFIMFSVVFSRKVMFNAYLVLPRSSPKPYSVLSGALRCFFIGLFNHFLPSFCMLWLQRLGVTQFVRTSLINSTKWGVHVTCWGWGGPETRTNGVQTPRVASMKQQSNIIHQTLL